MSFKRGSVVVRKDGKELFSGSETFVGAVVTSIDPFILVSSDLTMKWSNQKIEDFEQHFMQHIALSIDDDELQNYIDRGNNIKPNLPKKIFSENDREISALQAAEDLVRWLKSIEKEDPDLDSAHVKILSIKTCAHLIQERATTLINRL